MDIIASSIEKNTLFMSLEDNTGLQIYSNCYIIGEYTQIMVALGPAVDTHL